MNVREPWFYWALLVAIGLPVSLIALTGWHQALAHNGSYLARPVALVRNYLLPLGALLVLLVPAGGVPAHQVPVRVIYTAFGFALLLLLLSGLNVTLFQGAPEGSWRSRIPTIFIDAARFLLIGVGLALILSYVWGARIGGLFAALGVTSVVIGLMLQNSVGQIVSGLFMLFEQPFRIGDWLQTPAASGRVVEVNWRAVHIRTGSGLQITPNSVLAGTSFTNISRSAAGHQLSISTTFAVTDPPERVCALLSRVAAALPQRRPGGIPTSVTLGGGQYRTAIPVGSPDDDAAAQAVFQRWVWYAARRARLHLDDAEDEFSTTERVEQALQAVAAPALRLTDADLQALLPHAAVVRYGVDEAVERAGQVPTRMSFLIDGSVRMTEPTDDDEPRVTTLRRGALLGVTALTRQPSRVDAHALEETTVLTVDREHLEGLVMAKPLLLRDLGRIIDERQRTAP